VLKAVRDDFAVEIKHSVGAFWVYAFAHESGSAAWTRWAAERSTPRQARDLAAELWRDGKEWNPPVACCMMRGGEYGVPAKVLAETALLILGALERHPMTCVALGCGKRTGELHRLAYGNDQRDQNDDPKTDGYHDFGPSRSWHVSAEVTSGSGTELTQRARHLP
jgi:hypothetical protein